MLKRGHFRISDSGLTPHPQPVPSTHWSGSDSSQMAWCDDMGELGWEASFSRPYGFFYIILIYIFGCAGSLLLCSDFSLVAVFRLLIAVASFVAEHGLKSTRASVVMAPGL